MPEVIVAVYPSGGAQKYPRVRTSAGRIMLTHRYIMEQKLGRRLRRNEHVHHTNENKEDFSPGNLELMSRSEHTQVHGRNKVRATVKLVCPSCGKEFVREKRNVMHNRGQKAAYCSKRCVGSSRASGLVHGTTNGYVHHKCRCDLCRAANREKMRKYNEGLRARTGV